jgi:hypothetical protein
VNHRAPAPPFGRPPTHVAAYLVCRSHFSRKIGTAARDLIAWTRRLLLGCGRFPSDLAWLYDGSRWPGRPSRSRSPTWWTRPGCSSGGRRAGTGHPARASPAAARGARESRRSRGEVARRWTAHALRIGPHAGWLPLHGLSVRPAEAPRRGPRLVRQARRVLDQQRARPPRAITEYDEALMYVRRSAPGDRDRAREPLPASAQKVRRTDRRPRDGPGASPHVPER